jgi:hypothetical protein
MSGNLVPVEPRVCDACGERFTPKVGGYNARYCSKSCKSRLHRARESAGLTNPGKQEKHSAYVRHRLRTDPAFKAKHVARANAYRTNTRQWLADYKLSHGCVDCGFKGHFAALQLDHEGPKSISIGHARSSIARLKAEIESGQCKVRCANCHAIKTWERKQAGKESA